MQPTCNPVLVSPPRPAVDTTTNKRATAAQRNFGPITSAMIYRHTLAWVAILGLIVLMFLRLPPMVAQQDSLINVYGPLVEVDALCRQQYVEPIRDTRLVEGAIRGMMLRLDPYSGYIAPDELAAFERRSDGDYTGVGIVIGYRLGRLTVIAPIEGSPASRADVRPGDVLLAIDGLDVSSRSVVDVEDMLVGRPGEPLTLRLLHTGATRPIDIALQRDHVHIASVRGFARTGQQGWDFWIDRDRRLAYLRVSHFRAHTMDEFNAALKGLIEAGMKGLVIDLRFNPGGIMHQAIAMVDRFVDHGTILATVTRRRAVDEYRATSTGTILDLPLVVLVNGGSASSSEIVSGALQALKRATVVGEQTFGKGSVQHVIHLADHGGALKLTTAHYRLPDGRIIHRTPRNLNSDAWGITPDMVVELSERERDAIRSARKALDLAFIEPHAAGEPSVSEEQEDAPGSAAGAYVSNAGARLTIDRQLRAALQVLIEQTTPSAATQ